MHFFPPRLVTRLLLAPLRLHVYFYSVYHDPELSTMVPTSHLVNVDVLFVGLARL